LRNATFCWLLNEGACSEHAIICQFMGKSWTTTYEFNVDDLQNALSRCQIVLYGQFYFDRSGIANTHVFESDKSIHIYTRCSLRWNHLKRCNSVCRCAESVKSMRQNCLYRGWFLNEFWMGASSWTRRPDSVRLLLELAYGFYKKIQN